ncbi:MAG: hypothetical protein LPL00_10255 [Alphaproteobacteria bacterium]|nr:hypothetical protein [Alphaproteobacteria bacterium]MDX5370052.1 hypothetical protein [Alphaproteobacteria bacterium]MDX5464630.1 hypothetical protein [Alphaproteobacteria bacterium]
MDPRNAETMTQDAQQGNGAPADRRRRGRGGDPRTVTLGIDWPDAKDLGRHADRLAFSLSAAFNDSCADGQALARLTAVGNTWSPVAGDTAARIASFVETAGKRPASLPSMAHAAKKETPFYPGRHLYKVVRMEAGQRLARHYAVARPDGADAVLLDGEAETIRMLNRTVPVRIDRGTVRDYVRFFFAFSRGRHGHFHIVEAASDLVGGGASGVQNAWARLELGTMIRPLRIAEDGGGGFAADATLLFKGALFACVVGIAADGTVSMGEEALLAEDMGFTAADHVR